MDKNSSEPSESSFELEQLTKARLVQLKELFQGTAWAQLQEELASFRQELLERAVRINHSEQRDKLLNVVQAFDYLLDGTIERRALRAEGQIIDKPTEMQHYMALDSADLRLAKSKEH